MIRFVKSAVLGIIYVGIYGALFVSFLSIFIIPVATYLGDPELVEAFGNFSTYQVADWVSFLKTAVIIGGIFGFFFGAIFGHAAGWGVALRRIEGRWKKLFLGTIGAITATFWLWSILIWIDIQIKDGRDLTLGLIDSLLFGLLIIVPILGGIIFESHKRNWWLKSPDNELNHGDDT